jgi:hypothetical protein
MKNNITFLILVLSAVFTFLFAGSSFAQNEVTVDGLSFNVQSVSYGKWSKPRHHMVNDMVKHDSEADETLSYIAVAYVMTNTNDTRKIDLDGKFDYKLFDDFGNRYRPMRKPEDYNAAVLTVSKNFPSLFPGEKYGETLFFEAPISTAKEIKLTINLERMQLSKPVELVFSTEALPGDAPYPQEFVSFKDRTPIKQKSFSPHQSLPAPVATPVAAPQPQVELTDKVIEGPKIIISSPLRGTILKQGESVHVRVESLSEQVPKRLIIIALDNTFDDVAPKKSSVYDINVPSDQAPGAYMINVIADWPKGEISSALLEFSVAEAIPLLSM